MKNKSTLIALIIIFAALMMGLAPYASYATTADCEDIVPPTIEISYPANCEIAAPQQITINGTASDNNMVDRVDVVVGNSSMVLALLDSETDSWSALVMLATGANNITAKAIDASGNIDETSIIVMCAPPGTDTTPPKILELWPSFGANITTKYLELGAVTDENATCRYDTYDKSYDAMNGTFELIMNGTIHKQSMTLEDGAYTYYVRCIDDAGNANNASKSTTFKVNTTANITVYDHDFSIVGFSAPATATLGNIVSVSAMIKNIGRFNETNIPIVFSIDNIPTQTTDLNISSLNNLTVHFNWIAALGNHRLSLFANLTTDGNLLDNSASANILVSAVPVPPPSGGGGGGGGSSGGGGGGPIPPTTPSNKDAYFGNITIPDTIKEGETLYASGCVFKLGKNSTVELYLDGTLKDSEKAVMPSICFNLSAGIPSIGKHRAYLWLNSSNIDITKYVTVNESRNETSENLTRIEISDIMINGSVREGIPATIRLPIKTSRPADVSISLFSDGLLIGQANASVDGTYTASFEYTFTESGKKTLRAFALAKDGGQDMVLKEITVEKNMPTGNIFSGILRNPYVIALLLLIVLLVVYYAYTRKKPEPAETEELKTENYPPTP